MTDEIDQERAPDQAEPGRKPGAPTKFSPEVVSLIVNRVKIGLSLTDAAKLSGIAHETACRWHRQGEKDPNSPYREFFEQIERARLALKEQLVLRAHELALQSPNVMDPLRILERRYPAEWGTTSNVQGALALSGAVGVIPGDAVLTGLAPADRKKVRDAYFRQIVGENPSDTAPEPAGEPSQDDAAVMAELTGGDQ